MKYIFVIKQAFLKDKLICRIFKSADEYINYDGVNGLCLRSFSDFKDVIDFYKANVFEPDLDTDFDFNKYALSLDEQMTIFGIYKNYKDLT
jgi:hypothetical protein